MKTLFLREVKVEQHTELQENIVYNVDSEGNEYINPFEGWYDDDKVEDRGIFEGEDYANSAQRSKIEVAVKNIDDFNKYTIDTDYVVEHKVARTSVEEKRPFIVYKSGDKASKLEEVDTIYKTDIKMPISDKRVQRIGYVIADEMKKTTRLGKNAKKNKGRYAGVINERTLIYRKKKFNHKKIGYMKIMECTDNKDLFVEVITNRGYKWVAALFMIVCLLLLIINNKNFDNWHFNLDNLRLFKSQEATEIEQSKLAISLNVSPVVENGSCNIYLSSIENDDITYIAKLYNEDNVLIWESEEISAGQGVDTIQLQEDMQVGSHKCILKCNTYSNNKYVGTVQSEVTLEVRE